MLRKKKFWKTRSSFREQAAAKGSCFQEASIAVVASPEPPQPFDSSEDSSSSCSATPTPPPMSVCMMPSSVSIMSTNGPVVANNWSRIRRKDSVKSSSTSSSSGCLSACSSSSTPSTADLSSVMGQVHPPNNAFEADYGPMGTIKRKPNLNLNPIIPLTNTTRILTKHNEDALVDIDETRVVTGGEENGNARHVQYGTLRLRRSHTDDRLSLNQLIYDMRQGGPSSMSSASSSSANGSCSARTSNSPSVKEDVSDDDADYHCGDRGSDCCDGLYLPLPPPPEMMSSSVSTLSLVSLPPPPPEFLDSSMNNSPDNSTSSSAMSTPKAMSPMIDVAPSSRYNSFDRRSANGTLTRCKSKKNCPGSLSHFGTGSRLLMGSISKPGKNSQRPSISPNGAGLLQGTTSTPPPPQVTLVATTSATVHQIQQHQKSASALFTHDNAYQRKYQPMYTSSSSSSSQENISSSNSSPSNTDPSRQSPEHFVTEQLEGLAPLNKVPGSSSAGAGVARVHCHSSNQQQEQIYDSVFTYRKNAGLIDANGQFIERPPPSSGGSNLQNQNNRGFEQNGVAGAVAASDHSQATRVINNQTYVKEPKRVTIAASFNNPPLYSQRSPMKGPLPPPPEYFLKDLHRVMDKKWKVAQTLSCALNQNIEVGEVMGFRDPCAVLGMVQQHQQNQQQQQQPPTYSSSSSCMASTSGYMPPSVFDIPHELVNGGGGYGQVCRASVSSAPGGFSVRSSINNSESSTAAVALTQQQQQQSHYYQQYQGGYGHVGSFVPSPGCPLPVPAPFFRKSKVRASVGGGGSGKPPPPPPVRSDQTRLSQRKLL